MQTPPLYNIDGLPLDVCYLDECYLDECFELHDTRILGSKLPLYYRDKAYLSLDKIYHT